MSAERHDYRTAEDRALQRFALDTRRDELPDPPENPDFLDLPESFQALCADRLERGAARTVRLTVEAREAWLAQVDAMHARRRAANDRRDAARARYKTIRMANRATVGDLAGWHGKR